MPHPTSASTPQSHPTTITQPLPTPTSNTTPTQPHPQPQPNPDPQRLPPAAAHLQGPGRRPHRGGGGAHGAPAGGGRPRGRLNPARRRAAVLPECEEPQGHPVGGGGWVGVKFLGGGTGPLVDHGRLGEAALFLYCVQGVSSPLTLS